MRQNKQKSNKNSTSMLDANEFLQEVMYVISGFDVNIVIKE